jgi:hypothetical protein
VVAHGARIDCEEVVDARIDGGGQIAPQRLAHDGALLARDLLEVLVLGAWERRLEGGVEITTPDPPLFELGLSAAADVPQLDVIHTDLTPQALGVLKDTSELRTARSERTPAHAEGGGDEGVAEQSTSDLDQGQHRGDRPALPASQVVRAMSEHPSGDVAPGQEVEEGGVGMRLDERVPF